MTMIDRSKFGTVGVDFRVEIDFAVVLLLLKVN